ncbi:MAG: DUF4344 domain-containing metallopeptidase [Granulosicoccus sp.]
MSRFTLLSIVCFCLGTLPASADVSLRWQDITDNAQPELAAYLADSNIISDFVELVDKGFTFDEPLLLVIGADSGPEFDVEKHAIKLPYSYLERAIRTQNELVDDGEEALALHRALDVVEYTLYHLLGHALVHEDSEDTDATAEAISTWLMLSYWPNGSEQWFEDTLAFSDASMKLDGPLSDYWHSHALYRIRRDTLRCWMLGKDPDRIETLMPAIVDTAEQLTRCESSWQKLDRQVVELIGSVLAPDTPLVGKK